MRRLAAVMAGTALAASGLVMTFGVTAAHADGACGSTHGTIPSGVSTDLNDPNFPVTYGPNSVTVIDAPSGDRFYIDDRGFITPAGENDNGFWIYHESNFVPDLQRGGDQVVVKQLPGTIPSFGPFSIDVPTDPPTHVITLFPSGTPGGSIAETSGEHDACNESATPDEYFF